MRRLWHLSRSIFRGNDGLWILLTLLWAGRYDSYFLAWMAIFCLLVELAGILPMRRLDALTERLEEELRQLRGPVEGRNFWRTRRTP